MVNARFRRENQRRQQLTSKPTGLKVPLIKVAGSIFFLALLATFYLSVQIFLGLHNNNNNNAVLEVITTHPDAIATIGYFISITSCEDPRLIDGAAVLKHSIHLASIHGNTNLGGRYDYRAHAIYSPAAKDCTAALAALGYHLVERPVPILTQDIRGDFLRSRIESNGCCGSKELLKLEAYTFTQYPIVVHMDVDAIILKPLDPLFDAMIGNRNNNNGYANSNKKNGNNTLPNIERMTWPKMPVPDVINAFFTRDCTLL